MMMMIMMMIITMYWDRVSVWGAPNVAWKTEVIFLDGKYQLPLEGNRGARA